MKITNPYLDINYVDRADEIETLFDPTVQDVKADPEFYAELVNDLLYHWVYSTRETYAMQRAKAYLISKSKK